MTLKTLLIFVLFLLPVSMPGQTKTYFDLNDKKVESSKLAGYYSIEKPDSTDLNRKTEWKYFLSGKIKSETHFTNRVSKRNPKKELFKRDGKFHEWYENGQLRKEINYMNGEFDGELTTYWDNGQVKRKENYEAGKSINGKCFDAEGKEIDYYSYEKMPEFPEGEKALLEYINRNLKYPVDMQKQGIQGMVILQFTVERDGKTSDIKVLRSVNFDLDKAAIWIVKGLSKFKPAMRDGETVPSVFTLPIRFKLQ